MAKDETEKMNIKTYVAAGAINIENIEHVENLYPTTPEVLLRMMGGGNAQSKSGIISDSDLRTLINNFIPHITKKRHWFPVIKVLMLHGQLRNRDFVGAAQRILALYPAGLDVEIDPADLQVMHDGSFRGPVNTWSKDSGPAKRDAELNSYITLGNAVESYLKENFSF